MMVTGMVSAEVVSMKLELNLSLNISTQEKDYIRPVSKYHSEPIMMI